jgi:PTS system ascorbate-specific IIC component
MGVRMIIAELVPSFKGISDKVIPGAIAGVDCPIVFPFAPNAVLIGFLSSLVAGFVSMGITIGISQAPGVDINLVAVILPGIIPHFFLGATSGVFGNQKGGVHGAVAGAFVHGMILSFVPMMFLGLQLSPNSSLN